MSSLFHVATHILFISTLFSLFFIFILLAFKLKQSFFSINAMQVIYVKKAVCLTIACFLFFITSQAQNAIVAENALPGNPKSEWDVTGAGDLSIQGFATDISVNKGNTIQFKIKTDASAYTITIYRLGYYKGLGARKIATVAPMATLPQVQPFEINDNVSGMTDCGTWNVSAQWAVPANAVSGVYIAKLKRSDNGGASHIVFIVRDDAGASDILFQTSDATWQAYNIYGGHSLYVGVWPTTPVVYPNNRATKVSYNRPFITRGGGGGGGEAQDWLFNAEYPMIRWLERNGYNVSYFTNVDAARLGNLITKHKTFFSVGHDEYWSAEAYNNIIAARNAGVHLAFFSGNAVYWKTRYEPSIDGLNTNNRTLVCYKEGTLGEFACGGKCDSTTNTWTGLWRDGGAYPNTDGFKPENGLTGQIGWKENQVAIEVPDTYKKYRFWRNTSITALGSGQKAVLSNGTLGYEWDFDNSQNTFSNPAGRIKLSATTINGITHNLSLYKHSSGALVFGAGTVQWSWGLDSVHDRDKSIPDTRIQQATVNLLADMGVQPSTLQPGVIAATAATDNTAPTITVTSPANGSLTTIAAPITFTGTANDANVVAGVDMSFDGGATWVTTNGTNNWSYTWTPTVAGTYAIKTRGIDDAGNMQPSASPITVIVSELKNPNNGLGGPILVIGNVKNPFSRYAVEILRAEGLTEFNALDITEVDATVLNKYDIVIVGETALTTAQVAMFTTWTDAGGVFIAFKPDVKLSGLLGLTKTTDSVVNKYLTIHANGPGIGIVNQSIQFHGAADAYFLNGATALATLYSTTTTALPYPAITVNNRLKGGKAVAFTYDLSKSIVYTRQGNPLWAGQKRDGTSSPVRPNDMFYPDWIDFNKIAIPQADEQQRMLANIIIQYNLNKKPLPRLWYLPRGLKAAIVMTGNDDSLLGKTVDYFNKYYSFTPANTQDDVANWQTVRSTSYIYPGATISNAQAQSFEAQGFEIGLQLNTNCTAWTPNTLISFLNKQLPQLAAQLPAIAAPTTHRIHCLAWSDWASLPKIEVQKGIRLNTTYSYLPGNWINDRPGMFTGSGFPMRFANTDGSLIDNYQLATQITNVEQQTTSFFCNQLLDKALGTEGYFGTFCVNWHTDNTDYNGAADIVNAALSRSVPVISAKQLLTWLDGRNNTGLDSIKWSNNVLSFTITGSTKNLEAMLPTQVSNNYQLISIRSVTGNNIYRKELIKGIEYAFFTAKPGNYTVTYEVPPTISITAPINNTIFNAPANIVITTNAADVNGTIANVQFYNGSILLGSDATSPYSFTWSNVPVGTYNITAIAIDNGGASATSTPIVITVINTLPKVNITSPTNNANFIAPASITISANAADANGKVTQVQFYNGNTLLSSDATAPYSFNWANVSVGTYVITAKVTDDNGATATSAPIMATVAPIILGPDCAKPNTTISFELNALKQINVIGYSWWASGAVASVTPIVGAPYKVNIKTGAFFTGAQVCVGTTLNVSPWYTSYCKNVSSCPSILMLNQEPLIADAAITVLPNPSVSSFTINATDAVKTYTVTDPMGNIVIQGKQIQKGESVQIGCLFKTGIYTLQLILQNGTIETKQLQKIK